MKSLKLIHIILILLISNAVQAENHDDEPFLNIKCATFQTNNKKIVKDRQLSEITDFDRPSLPLAQSSSSGRFLIHYTIEGSNAVNKEDNDNNGIPDYVDSVCYYFEYVHEVEVNQMGYLEPAADNGKGGSDAFDVYLLNIGKGDIDNPGLYGYTVPEDEIPGSHPDRIKYTAYIVMDNDYSQRDSSYLSNGNKYRTFSDTSYLGMKITAAHEYHHAVQFMYGEDVTAPSINEMTSTWLEYRVFPETRDYLQYVRYLFKYPNAYNFGNGNSVTGYLYSIFGQYLYRYYGDSILFRMWNLISQNKQSYDALNIALNEKNTDLASRWCDFMNWIYYTGERDNKTGFDNADEFPKISFYREDKFRSPAFTSSSGLVAYEFRFYRIIFESENEKTTPDIFDEVITNTDLRAAVFQSDYEMPYLLSVIDQSESDYTRIGNLDYYYKVDKPKGNICDVPFITEGELTNSICFAYPNPFKYYKDNTIYFPAPHDSEIGSYASLRIMDINLNEAVFTDLKVVINSEKRVMEFNPDSYNLSSGVYIFTVSNSKSECSGKIAIIKSE